MSNPFLQTERLALKLEPTEAVLACIAAMPPEDQAEVLPEWLARLRSTPTPTPWTHGMALVERATGAVVGSAGFKGPPNDEGVVEVTYGIAPAYRGRGYAREAARALSEYALGEGGAMCVRAHTRSDNAASARVLAACGFTLIGEVLDPDDGLVQRWERRASQPSRRSCRPTKLRPTAPADSQELRRARASVVPTPSCTPISDCTGIT